eukprot:349676-Chlamydomonas_euryale.AAC.2
MRRTSCFAKSSAVACTPGSSSGSSGATSAAARAARRPASTAAGRLAAVATSSLPVGASIASTDRRVVSASRSSVLSTPGGAILRNHTSTGPWMGAMTARSGPSASTLRSAAIVAALPMTMRSASDSASRDIASVAATNSSTSSCMWRQPRGGGDHSVRARVRLTRSGPTKGMPVLSIAWQGGSSSGQGAVTKGTPLRTVLSHPTHRGP